jgi:transposase
VPCPGAVPLVAERGDLTRVEHPRPLLNSRGLLPAASSRGERRRQGALTTAGNTPARRALLDGAWAYRYPATVSRPLPRRLEQQPPTLQDISWQAHVRLGQRARRVIARGTHANPVGGPWLGNWRV